MPARHPDPATRSPRLPPPEEAEEPSANASGFSQSLERGLMILSALSERRPVLGIADIAREVGLSKSTTYRYVSTLAKLEYLHQDPDTKKYSLGSKAVDLG